MHSHSSRRPRVSWLLGVILLLLLLALQSQVISSTLAQAAAIRIMPLGDSITQASAQHLSYRRPLWQLLKADNRQVDFVGSLNTNYLGPPPVQDFDLDHEGHWGWRTDEILAHLPGWAATAQPDIVLIHLGTTDLVQGQTVASTLTELGQVIDILRSANPNVKVLLAQVIPSTVVQVDSLNAGIADLAAEKDNAQSSIILVDQYSSFDEEDMYDGVHPDDSGEAKIANRWYQGLQRLWNGVTSTRVPPASLPDSPIRYFYRAINLNGDPFNYGGDQWEGKNAPNYLTNGTPSCNLSAPLYPSTNSLLAAMIRCFVQHTTHELTLTNVPDGEYDVFVYAWRDWPDLNPQPFSAQLEGQPVQSNIVLSGSGTWIKLGPWHASMIDGELTLATQGGLVNLSGIEVWNVDEDRPTNTPIPTPTYLLPTTTPVSTRTPIPPTSTFAPPTPTELPPTITPYPTSTMVNTYTPIPTATALPTETPEPYPPPPDAQSLYRAINLGGVATTIDGRPWESSSAANYTTNGFAACNPWQDLNPMTDAERTSMIRCHVQHWAHSLSLSSVPDGPYAIYLYAWLDWADPSVQPFSVQLEGEAVESGILLSGAGTWRRLGPWSVYINDGALDLTTSGGLPNLSGIEVWNLRPESYPTPVPTRPTSTPVSTSTPIPATSTTVVTPTLEPTSTPVPPTLEPTSTPVATGTVVPPTNTPVLPMETPLPPEGTPEPSAQGFYRAINLGGDALTIDGNAWEGSDAPFYTTNGNPLCNLSTPLIPSTDSDHAAMISCSVQHWAHLVTMSGMPEGSYDVYAYAWVDWDDPSQQPFSVQLDGELVESGILLNQAGDWRKLGPWRVTVTNGTLELATDGALINLSGIEVWRVLTGGPGGGGGSD